MALLGRSVARLASRRPLVNIPLTHPVSYRPSSRQSAGVPTHEQSMNGVTSNGLNGKDTASTGDDDFKFDDSISLESLRQLQDKFVRERDWEQFHTPRNLLLAMVAEVGELSELFQWKGEVATGLPGWSAKEKAALGDELSDVLCYLIRLADRCQVDLPTAAVRKIQQNSQKYPAEKMGKRPLSASSEPAERSSAMGVLDPKKIVCKRKVFHTSRYPRLEKWNKTRIYPNPITYKGPFENERNDNFTIPQIHFEMICDEIRKVQNTPIQNPSPIHMAWRSQPLTARAWWERVIMRRLGLHDRRLYQRLLFPNTPHFNRLLYQVKHLITMKPLTFPDGIPTEKDIGAIRVEDHSGVVRINEQFRVPDHRLYGDKKPEVFEGKSMRNYMRRTIGIFMNHW